MTDLTETDRKIVYSDHDLLVRLNTVMDMSVKQQAEFMDRYTLEQRDIVQRLTALEVNRASDVAAIKSNKEDVDALQKRSNLFDGINAGATAIVAALAFWFGGGK